MNAASALRPYIQREREGVGECVCCVWGVCCGCVCVCVYIIHGSIQRNLSNMVN